MNKLSAWRDVITPHPDVCRGKYKQADFAADLYQASRGGGSTEYSNPSEFFSRTYITDGMRGLLAEALRRVTGNGGEPVIQIKTAFGGGKTHSMLALYHLMRGVVPANSLDNVRNVLASVGVSNIPKVNIAVLVGTAENPASSFTFASGITANTLWGNMAAQLAESSGNPGLYEIVRASDVNGVSPGSRALMELFDSCGPCMVLMDEITAYARKLYMHDDLVAGTFDNFMTFIQELTEAARLSRNSLVAASIPESETEAGGPGGSEALKTIEHIFGRLEAIWKPVTANESFEVVRRRLFGECTDLEARENTANAFHRLYIDNPGDFPFETKEKAYRDRIISCYPIHPEIFDRLYEEWSALEKFQRTRGVLRLMADVIHVLWEKDDRSPLIMPCSFPLDVPFVRDELIRCLPDGWNSVTDTEVDGEKSIPYRKDMEIQRFGKEHAARRVARTIMLGSAPAVREQSVRGIESSRIRLGTVMPEESIALFNDALSTLQNSLSYLYTNSSGDRFWYDTRPTLRKTAEDRAWQILPGVIDREITDRLKKFRREYPFDGVHVCPKSSFDVPDEQALRLVVLGPDEAYSEISRDDSPVFGAVRNILDNHGNSPRKYRNMIVFIAPDSGQVEALRKTVRYYLAWRSIVNDNELNLDTKQRTEAKNHTEKYNSNVDNQLKGAWCWVLSPYTDKKGGMKSLTWCTDKIIAGNESVVSRAAESLKHADRLIDVWGSALLKHELDGLLWNGQNDINIKTLWEELCTYCYLPRLTGWKVFERAVIDGVNVNEYFALAEDKDNNGYKGIKYSIDTVSKSDYLVKRDVVPPAFPEPQAEPETSPQQQEITPEPPKPRKITRFVLSAPTDNTRMVRDINKLLSEVVNHVAELEGAEKNISIEVNIDVPEGIPQDVIEIVEANCGTLHLNPHFE